MATTGVQSWGETIGRRAVDARAHSASVLAPGRRRRSDASMPVPQIAPPGHLDQHGLLVAVTPMLLCLVTALAVWLIGERASARRFTAVRLLAGVNLLGALCLQGLFLLPWGAAAAYTTALGGGFIRVGWLVTGTAFVLGLWSWWYWSPLRTGRGSASRWCLRVALALALPVLALPALVIAVLADDPRAPGRWCYVVAALAVLMTALAIVPGIPPSDRWHLSAYALLFAGGTVVGPWRWPVVAALAAGILSW